MECCAYFGKSSGQTLPRLGVALAAMLCLGNPASAQTALTPQVVAIAPARGTTIGAYVAGNYAYVADGTNGLQIIDVSNPAQPTLVAGVNTGGDANTVHVVGHYAYVADTIRGLVIVQLGPTLAFDPHG